MVIPIATRRHMTNIDLGTALKKFHELQLEDGDLGAEYWRQVTTLLMNAQQYRERAQSAEDALQQIRNILNPP